MVNKEKENILFELKNNLLKVVDSLDALIVTMLDEDNENIDAEVETKEEKKVISLEEVRTVLANLSRDGFTKEVKDLLRKHGGEKLSVIKPEEYEAIINEAEEIKNAK